MPVVGTGVGSRARSSGVTGSSRRAASRPAIRSGSPSPSGSPAPSIQETATAVRSPNVVTGVSGSGTANGGPAAPTARRISIRPGMARAPDGRRATRTAATPGSSTTS
ncbi:hypothetical protein ACFQYP_22115 [Nonomuraea antimicrobica]